MSDPVCTAINIDAPVILLGRGGSGTRMMSEIAQGLGMFLGNDVNVSGDSIEWVGTLYELAIENLATDMRRLPERSHYWHQRLRRLAGDVLTTGGNRPSDVWGWKLPETMLALAPVLHAFPEARVIHLVRHPVASALRRTHMTSRMDNAIGQAVLPAAYRFCGLDPHRIDGDAVHIHNAATWAFQIASVLDVLRAQNPRVLQIYYEEMCRDPRATQAEIAQFLGCDVSAASAVPQVDAARFSEGLAADPRARDVWALCGALANALGYAEDGSCRRQASRA